MGTGGERAAGRGRGAGEERARLPRRVRVHEGDVRKRREGSTRGERGGAARGRPTRRDETATRRVSASAEKRIFPSGSGRPNPSPGTTRPVVASRIARRSSGRDTSPSPSRSAHRNDASAQRTSARSIPGNSFSTTAASCLASTPSTPLQDFRGLSLAKYSATLEPCSRATRAPTRSRTSAADGADARGATSAPHRAHSNTARSSSDSETRPFPSASSIA